MSCKRRYRIRGLPAWAQPAEGNSCVNSFNKVSLGNLGKEEAIPWYKAVEAVGTPHINNYLHAFDSTELSQLWPTLSFLHPRASLPIKKSPVTLAAYLDADEADHALREIWNAYQKQEDEIASLRLLVKCIKSATDPKIENLHPIASAFASALLRGSRWLQKHRAEIFAKIVDHPAAAYIALQSGVWNENSELLDQALTADPLLLLFHSKYGGASQMVHPQLVEGALLSAPHLRCLLVNANIPVMAEAAWNHLIEAARENLMAAAFALGLQPENKQAETWKRQLLADPGAMYWAVRVGAWGADPTVLPYWSKFGLFVSLHPQWGYHWNRDFEPGLGYGFARNLWPDPWAVELAVDLKLSCEWVLKEFHALEIERPPEDALHTAITLWSADYVTKDDEED